MDVTTIDGRDYNHGSSCSSERHEFNPRTPSKDYFPARPSPISTTLLLLEPPPPRKVSSDDVGNNSNLYFTETEENIMTSMRYKSKDLNKVRGANMAGGANRNLSEQGAEHHKVKEWM